MQSARDMSNVFLADRVRAKDRMRALTATTHLVDEEHLDVLALWIVAGIVWTMCGLVWWLT